VRDDDEKPSLLSFQHRHSGPPSDRGKLPSTCQASPERSHPAIPARFKVHPSTHRSRSRHTGMTDPTESGLEIATRPSRSPPAFGVSPTPRRSEVGARWLRDEVRRPDLLDVVDAPADRPTIGSERTIERGARRHLILDEGCLAGEGRGKRRRAPGLGAPSREPARGRGSGRCDDGDHAPQRGSLLHALRATRRRGHPADARESVARAEVRGNRAAHGEERGGVRPGTLASIDQRARGLGKTSVRRVARKAILRSRNRGERSHPTPCVAAEVSIRELPGRRRNACRSEGSAMPLRRTQPLKQSRSATAP